MRTSKFFIAIAAAALLLHSAMAENTTVVNVDGKRLSVIAEFPPGEGKFPVVVLAPGQGYHMALPALEATARALVEQGVAVFRFDWSYFTAEPKGQPSADLSKELQDFQAVLDAARRHPKVLSMNMSVGGKSLGSLVAWRAFAADSTLQSALLLTPICSRVPKGESLPRSETKVNYPGFEAEQRPTLWISGNKDALCAPSVLYSYVGARADVARAAIVGGDHSFEIRVVPSAVAGTALTRNLAAVSAISASFVAETACIHP